MRLADLVSELRDELQAGVDAAARERPADARGPPLAVRSVEVELPVGVTEDGGADSSERAESGGPGEDDERRSRSPRSLEVVPGEDGGRLRFRFGPGGGWTDDPEADATSADRRGRGPPRRTAAERAEDRPDLGRVTLLDALDATTVGNPEPGPAPGIDATPDDEGAADVTDGGVGHGGPQRGRPQGASPQRGQIDLEGLPPSLAEEIVQRPAGDRAAASTPTGSEKVESTDGRRREKRGRGGRPPGRDSPTRGSERDDAVGEDRDGDGDDDGTDSEDGDV